MTILHGHPVGILLAAGSSRRFGRNKLLEPIGEQSVIERAVGAFRKSRQVDAVVIVHAPGHADDFGWLAGKRVHLLENPDPAPGMITSIRTALRSKYVLEKDFLIHPADVPFVTPEVIDRVVQTFVARPCKIVIPTYRGMGGHPGMFSAELAHDFLIRGDKNGAREILLRHKGATVHLPFHDPDICFDVDSPADLQAAGNASARWARVEAKLEAHRTG